MRITMKSMRIGTVLAIGLLAAFCPPGGAWMELSGSATGGGISNSPAGSGSAGLSVDMDGLGRAVVAWTENANLDLNIFLKRWNGSQWEELDGSATGGGVDGDLIPTNLAWDPVVRVDPNGNPVVAYAFGPNPFGVNVQVHLRRWNGAIWEELNGSATGPGVTNGISVWNGHGLTFDAAGNPIVAYADTGAGNISYIHVRRYNGVTWEDMGGGAQGMTGTSGAIVPMLASDGAGNPVLAWREQGGFLASTVYMRSWNGAAWVELGGSATAGGVNGASTFILGHDIAVDGSGNPMIAWQAGAQIYLRRWNGASWSGMGGSETGNGLSNATNTVGFGGLATTSSGNPVVGYSIQSTPPDILVRAWNGSSWVGLSGSATPPGIAGLGGDIYIPKIAVGPSGIPAVAWADDTSTTLQVYSKIWSDDFPQNLSQSDGVNPIASGGTLASGSDVTLDAQGGSVIAGATTTIEYEVRLTSQPFTGTPTHQGNSSVTIQGLADGDYHWQARAMNSLGLGSCWVTFGGNPDFSIAGGGTGTGSTSGGGAGGGRSSSSSGGGCTASMSGGNTCFVLITILWIVILAQIRRRL